MKKTIITACGQKYRVVKGKAGRATPSCLLCDLKENINVCRFANCGDLYDYCKKIKE